MIVGQCWNHLIGGVFELRGVTGWRGSGSAVFFRRVGWWVGFHKRNPRIPGVVFNLDESWKPIFVFVVSAGFAQILLNIVFCEKAKSCGGKLSQKRGLGVDINGLYWPTNLYKLLKNGMFMSNMKEINQKWRFLERGCNKYKFSKIDSKCVLRTRIWACFMEPGLDLTVEVVMTSLDSKQRNVQRCIVLYLYFNVQRSWPLVRICDPRKRRRPLFLLLCEVFKDDYECVWK